MNCEFIDFYVNLVKISAYSDKSEMLYLQMLYLASFLILIR